MLTGYCLFFYYFLLLFLLARFYFVCLLLMTLKPTSQYSEEMNEYLCLMSQMCGKPQKISVEGTTAYWTQGIQQELYHCSVDDPSAGASRLFTALLNADEDKELSHEEELLRERMRCTLTGIAAFNIRKSDGAVFYTTQTSLFIYYTTGVRAHTQPLNVLEYASNPSFKCVPCMYVGYTDDSFTDFVFVYDNNLYSAHITENLEDDQNPLSVEVTAVTTFGDKNHVCGEADYIIQEEFDRYTGHYENKDYIVFSYSNSCGMRTVSLLKDDSTEVMPYPRVGDPNSICTIVVFHRETKTYRYLPLRALSNAVSFQPEYIPRFGFKNENSIYIQLLSRTQEQSAILSCSIDRLVKITEESLSSLYAEAPQSAKAETISVTSFTVECEQTIPWAWVEVFPKHPLVFGDGVDIMLRHASETASAHAHIYARPSGGSKDAWTPLTAGEYNVTPGSVELRGGHVFFIANALERLTQSLYCLKVPDNLGGGKPPQPQLLSTGHQHVTGFGVDGESVVYTASTAAELTSVHTINWKSMERHLTIEAPAWLMPLQKPRESIEIEETFFCGVPITLPHVITVENDRGVLLNGLVYIAPKKYAAVRSTEKGSPLVVYVYGGPHVQLVHRNHFDSHLLPAVQCFLQQGLSVAVLDNQVSYGNSLREQSICKKNMGHFEIDDYRKLVKAICEGTVGLPDDFTVDPARVGIYGWSYGGYASLLAMCQAPDVFKMCFSGAPVGDWELYDTGYTERYMGLLKDVKKHETSDSYRTSSIRHFASGFPDDIDRVYIAHGLLDENVHFTNTCHITSAMVENSKPYSLLLYPGERHGLRQQLASRLHHDGVMMKTFVEKL